MRKRSKNQIEESEQMIMWAVVLIGFLTLTAFVIAMGRSSTSRYERALQSKAVPARPAVRQPVELARAA